VEAPLTSVSGVGGADISARMLVLCADHELNVSSFTARCVASAGSHPYAVVTAALGVLEGPKHTDSSSSALRCSAGRHQ